MSITQDPYQRARECWQDAVDAGNEERARMVEDLKFSNPVEPEQWDAKVKLAREQSAGGARPTYAFDQTNQYIAQVVNDARKNKPQIQTIPSSSGARQEVSEALDGLIRQIEYASSASIAYDTAVEQAARIGLGWLRWVPTLVDGAYNEQEPRILSIQDALAVRYDPSFVSPDGQDQEYGFVESRLAERAFKRKYPGRKTAWQGDDADWGDDKQGIRICEYFYREETSTNMLLVSHPDDPAGAKHAISEQDYWDAAKSTGVRMPYHSQFKQKSTRVMWAKMDGDDFLEDPVEFPCSSIPLYPVFGYVIWIEGKRYICGMTRRMMQGQRAYNLERCTELEWMSKQPKSPYLVAWQSVANHQKEWQGAHEGNDVYLPYDHLDGQMNPLPGPTRLNPPQPGAAFTDLGQKGIADLQASVGMYRANLGAPSNETSGLAIRRREEQGDTANFHYIDNTTRTLTRLGRDLVEAIPRLYTSRRAATVLGLDGTAEQIHINPGLGGQQPFKKQGKKVVEINLSTGQYDVRCKAGPAYASLREETADALTRIVSSSPQLMTVLGPMWARMQDWPEAEHLSKLLLAIAPPPIQAVEADESDISPVAMAQIEAAKQQIAQLQAQVQHLAEALTNAAQQHEKAEQLIHNHDNQAAVKQNANLIAKYQAETDRLKLMAPYLGQQAVAAVVMQLLQSTLENNTLENTVPMPTQVTSMPAQAPEGFTAAAGGPPGTPVPPQAPTPPQVAQQAPN
jgi:hypothetical protein